MISKADASEPSDRTAVEPPLAGHRVWTRLTHALVALSVIVLLYSGLAILMAHPRLYWGQTGNSLTPALVELPWGPNYHNVKFGAATHFFGPDGPVSRPRLVEVYNLNGWARSLHFLAAWAFLLGLSLYLGFGLVSGHIKRNLTPSRAELGLRVFLADLRAHLRLPLPAARGGPPYNLLQKLAYFVIAVILLPLMVLTGLAMSPAVTAAAPWLMDLFGGYQSARTVHFAAMSLILAFLAVHLVMMALTGFGRLLRGMTIGG